MDPESEISVSEIFGILKKRILLFSVLFAVVIGVDVFITLLMPPLYKASAKMIIQNESDLYPAGVLPNTVEDNIFLNTQKEIISSSFIIDSALEDVNASGILKDADYYKLKNRISARFLNDSNMLEVSAYLSKPKEAVELVNAIVRSFLRYHTGARIELVDRSIDIVDKEITALRADKDELSVKLNNLRNKEQLNFFQAQIPQYVNNMLELNKKNLAVKVDIARLEGELEKTSNAIKSRDLRFFYPLMPAIGTVGENPTLSITSIPWMQDLKMKLTDSLSNLSRLSVEYTDNNPEVIGLNNQIALLRENLDSELEKTLSTYADYYKGYIQFLHSQQDANELERVRNESELNKIAQNIDIAAARQIEFDTLLKNYDAIQDIYAISLRKQNELQTLKARFLNGSLSNMLVLELAALPLRQVSPNFPLNMAVGIFLGIFIGVSGVLMEEKRDLSKFKAKSPQGFIDRDRRRMSRIGGVFKVACELKDKTAQAKYHGTTGNISGSGLCLRMNKYLPIATELSLEIHISDKELIRAMSKIVWVNPIDNKGVFDAGLHFIKITPQEREILINCIYGEHCLAERN